MNKAVDENSQDITKSVRTLKNIPKFIPIKSRLEIRGILYTDENTSNKNIISISNKIKKICKIYNVKFIINDNPIIAKKVCADGCHLRQSSMNIIRSKSYKYLFQY